MISVVGQAQIAGKCVVVRGSLQRGKDNDKNQTKDKEIAVDKANENQFGRQQRKSKKKTYPKTKTTANTTLMTKTKTKTNTMTNTQINATRNR